ncbi:MAG TPA: ABC transporter permease [Victivallales bacterium]|nr:ABC transporter permease [Victivallales bacterium]
MINSNIEDSQLIISGLPKTGLNLKEIQSNFDHINTKISNQIKSILIDLTDITHQNYTVLSFIISLGENCREHDIKLNFKNLSDEKLNSMLLEVGIDSSGKITSEKIKKEKRVSVFETAGECIYKICGDFRNFAGFVGDVIYAIRYFITHPRRLNYQDILFYMDKNGTDGIPIVCLICFLVGLIIAYQSIAQLAVFGLEVYVADLVALTLVRELGPLMVAVICIGRAGSAYAAEIGTMKVSEEIDAMTTMGIKPARVLVIPKMLALIIIMPMLTMIGDVAGVLGGLAVGVPLTNVSFIEYTNRTLSVLSPACFVESLSKGVVFAIIIAVVGCLRGIETENNAKGVGKSTTSAVVTSILLVIVADFVFTFSYPQILGLMGISY